MRYTLEGETSRDRPVVWKTTDYGITAETAGDRLDGLRVLFIVRHPFYSISSLMNLRRKQPHRYQMTPLRILEEAAQIQKMFARLTTLRARRAQAVSVVRFEDLVTDTRAALQPSLDDLGIRWDDSLTHPTFFGQAWNGDSGFEIMRGIVRSPLDQSRVLLNAEERDLVATCLADFMEEFGYDPVAFDGA